MRRKTYGSYKVLECWFCASQATSQTVQGVPSCRHHTKNSFMQKCLCGQWLDPCNGKYGFYFNCMNCGNLSESKVRSFRIL